MVKKQNRKKTIIAIFICICIISIYLASIIFIAENSNHECIGDKCTICLHIQASLNMLGQLDKCLSHLWSIGFLLAWLLLCKVVTHCLTENYFSLVNLKVRMNN